MAINDASEFTRELRAIDKQHRESLDSAYGEVVADTYAEILRLSEPFRKTGAYMGQHAIYTHSLSIGGTGFSIVYRNPDWRDPDERITELDSVDRPNADAAAQEVEQKADLALTFVIENERFYAHFLEYGTASMAAKAVYQQAEIFARRRAEQAGLA
jgi:hypothetical protein